MQSNHLNIIKMERPSKVFKAEKTAKQKSEVFSISLTEEHKEMAKRQSKKVLGKENVSGYFTYLLERENNNL